MVLVLEDLVVLLEQFDYNFFRISGWCIDLNYYDTGSFALEMNQDHSVLLRSHPSTAFQALLLTMRDTPLLLRDSCL